MPRIVDDELAIGDQVRVRFGWSAGLVGEVDQIVEGFEYSSQDVIFLKVPGVPELLQVRRRDLQYTSDHLPRSVEYGRWLVHRRRRVRPTPVAASLALQPGPSKRKREAAAVAEFSNAVDGLQEKGKLDEQEWKQLLELGMKLYNA